MGKWQIPIIKIKRKGLLLKRKCVANKFNEKCFICNKTRHLVNNYKNKAQQRNPKKKIAQANIIKIDHLTKKYIHKWIIHLLFLKLTWSIIPNNIGLTLVSQDMYAWRREYVLQSLNLPQFCNCYFASFQLLLFPFIPSHIYLEETLEILDECVAVFNLISCIILQ